MKKVIITADDFGISENVNLAIKDGFENGILTSTCIMANGEAFEHATEKILPQIQNISLGVHLNIIEGKTQKILSKKSLLYDENGCYKNGFIELLKKSYDNNFLQEVEADFRTQIETVQNKANVTFINSHVHTHSIPKIFELTAKLANEYGIKYIRTQAELPYFVPVISKHFNAKYPVNLIKWGLLNTFTLINQQTIKKYNLISNEHFIGVTYTGYMDENTIKYGIKRVTDKDSLTEIIIHPTIDERKLNNYREYLAVTNKKLKNEISSSNVELTTFEKN